MTVSNEKWAECDWQHCLSRVIDSEPICVRHFFCFVLQLGGLSKNNRPAVAFTHIFLFPMRVHFARSTASCVAMHNEREREKERKRRQRRRKKKRGSERPRGRPAQSIFAASGTNSRPESGKARRHFSHHSARRARARIRLHTHDPGFAVRSACARCRSLRPPPKPRAKPVWRSRVRHEVCFRAASVVTERSRGRNQTVREKKKKTFSRCRGFLKRYAPATHSPKTKYSGEICFLPL